MSTYSEELVSAQKTVTITPKSLIMKEIGTKFRGLYLGQSEFTKADPKTGELKVMRTANFYDGEKVLFNMGAQLTRSLAPIRPGISMEIELVELKKNGAGGETKIYSITPLNIPVKDLRAIFGDVYMITAPSEADLLPEQSAHTTEQQSAKPETHTSDADKRALWGE